MLGALHRAVGRRLDTRAGRIACLLAVALIPGAAAGLDAYLDARRLVALKQHGELRIIIPAPRGVFAVFARDVPAGQAMVATVLPKKTQVWVPGVVKGDRVRREARRGAVRALDALAGGLALALFVATGVLGDRTRGKSPGQG